jgi:Arc/MetJ-type ribon-helix-helix transcriptional regulator
MRNAMVTIAKLPKETEAEIQRLIDSGEFDDVAAVVVRAVHTLARERTQAEHERKLVRQGIDEAKRGDLIDDSPEFRRSLRDDAHILAMSGKPLNPDVCG